MNRNSLAHQFARRSRAHAAHMRSRPIAPVTGPLPKPEAVQERLTARRAPTPWARVAGAVRAAWARVRGRP